MQIFSQLFSFFNQNAYYCWNCDEICAGGFFLSYTHIEARKRGNLSPIDNYFAFYLSCRRLRADYNNPAIYNGRKVIPSLISTSLV